MELLKTCPNCGFDLEKVKGIVNQDILVFCLQCQFPLPLVAGKYRLEKELWRGGSSIVYLARHIHLERDAERVVKIIRPEIFKIHGMEHRFRREVQITSALSQRNEHIVRIYDDFGEIPKLGHFYVMEHLQGETLHHLLHDLETLPSLPFCFYLFLQLCDTMQFAHETGVVHRDLKPHNLMLVSRKHDPYFLKVYDFGIAKPLSTEELAVTHVTQGSLGTPAYMSPEQCLNQPTDVPTDIYAMGILLYEMLVGYTPFLPVSGDISAFSSAVSIIEGHLMREPPSLRAVFPERISESLERIVLQTLAKKPEDRFQSVESLRVALEQTFASWPSEEQALLQRLLSDKVKPTLSLQRKSRRDQVVPEVLQAEEEEHSTWYLGASSRVVLAGEEWNPSQVGQRVSEGSSEPALDEKVTPTSATVNVVSDDLSKTASVSPSHENQVLLSEFLVEGDEALPVAWQEGPQEQPNSLKATVEMSTLSWGDESEANGAVQDQNSPVFTSDAFQNAPTVEQAAPKIMADRVQGPNNGWVRMFVTQQQDWESEPFLVKKFLERIAGLQKFIRGADFERLYPHCQGKIVVEAHSFPSEIANRLVAEGVELRLLPKKQDKTWAAGATDATPSVIVTMASSSPPSQPALTAANRTTPSGKTSRSSLGGGTLPATLPTVGQAVSPLTTGSVQDKSDAMDSREAMLQTIKMPMDAPVPGQSPTPVALWEEREESKVAENTPFMTPALLFVVGIFVLSVIGMLYGIQGNSASLSPDTPQGVILSQVSSLSMPAASYVKVSLTPDHATFAFIPVVDNRSGAKEYYVLFAAKENRRLLVFASHQESQIVRTLKEDRDPLSPNVGTSTPVWSQDLQGFAERPHSRTYTGSLEKLQRYTNGPLELSLPDGNRNINKILGYRQQGIQFPMDSMILKVGQRPKPPENPYRGGIFLMSLLLALISVAIFVGVRQRQQRAF